MIADQSYREIARVRAGNGLAGDLHDIELTDRGTAFITIYAKVDADLSVVDSDKDGEAMDSVIQEVDVATGEVRLGVAQPRPRRARRVARRPAADPPVRVRLLPHQLDRRGRRRRPAVSARNTWGVYKIDKRTGSVLWRLGGLRSDFALGPGVRFAWQHDARWLPDGTITCSTTRRRRRSRTSRRRS